jgi:hypothetical protein
VSSTCMVTSQAPAMLARLSSSTVQSTAAATSSALTYSIARGPRFDLLCCRGRRFDLLRNSDLLRLLRPSPHHRTVQARLLKIPSEERSGPGSWHSGGPVTSSVGPESSKSPAGGDVKMGEMRIG